MEYVILGMIICGVLIMVTNIIRFALFIRDSADVLSSGVKTDTIWKYFSLILLIFFLIGYILVAVIGKPDLIVAGILFGGSVFVALVLTLMFRLIGTVKSNCLNIAEALVRVEDDMGPNATGHSRYVRNVALLLYDYLPATKKIGINRVSLEFATLMHDVGKLRVPPDILNKPSSLNGEEWEILKKHPKDSVDILKPLISFREIFPWIEYHHERLDGYGYYQLKAKDIPLASRIISIADTYASLTSNRNYRAARTHENAIQVIRDVSGSQLDPELVNIFIRIPRDKLVACSPERELTKVPS